MIQTQPAQAPDPEYPWKKQQVAIDGLNPDKCGDNMPYQEWPRTSN